MAVVERRQPGRPIPDRAGSRRTSSSQQQYRDFLIFRRFRQTLLCRDDASLAREPDPEVLRSFYVGASDPAGNSEHPDVASDAPVRFATEKVGEVTTPHPLSKAAFLELGAIWPRWVAVSELLSAARSRVSAARRPSPRPRGRDADCSASSSRSYGANVTQLRSTACPFVTEISERPRASALARLQARTLTRGHEPQARGRSARGSPRQDFPRASRRHARSHDDRARDGGSASEERTPRPQRSRRRSKRESP